MNKILFINACARKNSRTKELADVVLSKLKGKITEVNLLKENLKPLTEEDINLRFSLTSKKDFSNAIFDKAREFATADIIVIAAPFYDYSFPANLKVYIENINVSGIVFRYTEKGEIEGLCKAKKVFYITTAGGPILNNDFGYGYIKFLCNNFYGIKDTTFIKAEGLDIWGADISAIMQKAKEEAEQI
ncbi:MAG: NAD(P)H-dependent oxidoreductase [Elusimicrobiaceae bacterium]|nr:NAD(P)H-dependent oxidoreductase [Elusimicrobiaceae bacterium]